MNRNRNFYLMCWISFLQGLVFYVPIATLYRQSRGLSLSNMFLIESIFMILMIILEIPWGYFADQFGYKITLVLGNLLFFISKVIFYKAHGFWLFFLERFFLALSVSAISGCDTAFIYSCVDKKDAEKAFGRYGAFATLGALLSAVSSTWIISISIDLTALLTVITYGIATISSFFLKEVVETEKIKKNNHLLSNIRDCLKDKKMILFIISIGLFNEISHTITIFLNQPQYVKSGIDLKYLGFILAGMQLLAMLSAYSYKITNKLGQYAALKILLIAITISCFVLSFTTRWIFSIILIGVISLSSALYKPISLDIQNKSIRTKNRATMLSIYAMIMDVISSFVYFLLGSASKISIEFSFISCGVMALIAFVMMFITIKKTPRFEA